MYTNPYDEKQPMKLLRRMIRQIILEGNVKDSFDELWYNSEEERSSFTKDYSVGSHHRDNLKELFLDTEHESIDQLFDDKRDLKRLWNKMIDTYDLRGFWEGPKMKYFHSLSYYGSPSDGVDKLSYSEDGDEAIQDLSAHGFFQLYNKSGNKDEMSTYGIYNNRHNIPLHQQKFGVLISGRVTLATGSDAFTESRSKATKKDIARHASSGMPKRILASDDMINALLFEESDIVESGQIGECVLDNWSIEAIVCARGHKIQAAAQKLAKQYGVPLMWSKKLGRKV